MGGNNNHLDSFCQYPNGGLPNGYFAGLILSMKQHEIRLKRLKRLIDDRFEGKAGKFADDIGKKRPQIYRLFSESEATRRDIGEELARDIEERAGLEKGWLDREDDGAAIPAAPVALPPELQAVVTSYQSGGPAKQAALAQLAAIPEQEMALILLMLQSIQSKYPEQPKPFISENLKNAERKLLRDLHESPTEATEPAIFIERRQAQ